MRELAAGFVAGLLVGAATTVSSIAIAEKIVRWKRRRAWRRRV